MNNKLLFIIGLRASGTSILRELIEQHPGVHILDFEPHDLLYSVSTYHIARYKNSIYHRNIIEQYRRQDTKYIGAKLAFNIGIEAGKWKFLKRYYPQAKFIFIKRNLQDNYKSWKRKDTKTLNYVLDKDVYEKFWKRINNDFKDYV